MRHVAQWSLLCVLCLLGTQQGQAQQQDQVPPPMPPVIEWPPERTAKLPETNGAVILGEAEYWPGATRPTQGAKRPVLAAQERCPEAPIDVTGASPEERGLACAAASNAIQLLSRCGISLRRPLNVQIMSEVRHPFSGPIFGLFDIKQDRVLVTQEANITAMVKDTPYAKLPLRDFYRSLIVHEVVHGIMHQNLKRPAASHAVYEYPAYALQIESLAPTVRDEFLQSFDQTTMTSDFMFNDSVLFFDPYFFAARAYRHFKASADRCAHLAALLQGEASFIAPPM